MLRQNESSIISLKLPSSSAAVCMYNTFIWQCPRKHSYFFYGLLLTITRGRYFCYAQQTVDITTESLRSSQNQTFHYGVHNSRTLTLNAIQIDHFHINTPY